MEDTEKKKAPAAPREDKAQQPGEKRWGEKGEDKAPRHEGPLPEGNGGTGAPASFPPHN